MFDDVDGGVEVKDLLEALGKGVFVQLVRLGGVE